MTYRARCQGRRVEQERKRRRRFFSAFRQPITVTITPEMLANLRGFERVDRIQIYHWSASDAPNHSGFNASDARFGGRPTVTFGTTPPTPSTEPLTH